MPPGPQVTPFDFEAHHGAGLDRALVLGGGGLFFVAWQIAYLDELARGGIPVADAQLVVGTSAGSLTAAVLTWGGTRRLVRMLEIIAKSPFTRNAVSGDLRLRPSQTRALELFRLADNNDRATIQAIGRAALAAHAKPARSLRRAAALTIGRPGWPSPRLRITAVDAYTAERLVVDDRAAVAASRAAAASSSVPGLFAPQPIGDRFCMDGGVSGSGTHSDLVAGARRAIVLSLSESFRGVPRPGLMTQSPGAYEREMETLASTGTRVLCRGPEEVDMTRLMSADATPSAMVMGRRQASRDAKAIARFWR